MSSHLKKRDSRVLTKQTKLNKNQRYSQLRVPFCIFHAINWSIGMPETVNEMLKSQDCFEKSPEELVAELENYFTENGVNCEITNGKLSPIEKIIEENL